MIKSAGAMWIKSQREVTRNRIIGAALVLLAFACVSSGQSRLKSPSKPAATKRTAIDRWIDGVVNSVGFQKEAPAAIEMLSEVLAAQNLNAEQKSRVEKELAIYTEYSKKGMVKLGSSWVPIADAAEATAKADQYIQEGIALIMSGDLINARSRFEEASNRDQNGLRADFILAMLHSPLGDYDPMESKDHFKEMLSRSPKLPCAMNNRALILVRLGEGHYREALDIWKKLDELEPGSPIVLNNVRKLVEDMHTGRLVPTNAEKKAIEKFYKTLLIASPDMADDEPKGWQYANLPLPGSEEKRTQFDQTAVPALSGTGSAFVVHPGYAVTALHLVRDANRVTIEFPDQEPVDTVIEKVSEVYDLAILKMPNVDIPPLPVNPSPLRPDAMATQFGFPSKADAVTMRQVKYSAASAPDDSDFLVFQTPPIRELRGGPLCDTSGNVIGIATSIGAMDGGQTMAIPVIHLISLMEKHIPAYSSSRKTEKVLLEAQVVESHHSPSIGRVEVYRKFHNFGIGRSTAPTYALDTKSSCCGDTGKVRCPAKGCNKGIVSVKKKVVVGNDPIAGAITGAKVFETNCPICNGTGQVNCRFPD